ncbi:GGDEF domain-containing protein [Kibdelosporangium phytohabitans]|uniref:GGDEF domain-containing protein n=1 Tax=Kibdelosporangium phytohabitans TaxID=860235 RepID=A0A0N9I8A0_9PSEU|nr:GGDEF domain-containing protein [Kibdelosporangium phytohabitans]ALG12449.1 hypothetical protein AOZ06_41310 [Kibdelosporangium phytohabitans]MBE1464041.1 diguanylate cyclase (GGDEF)-like protein [Kibdelosporangium phytohabitans]
MNRKRARHRFPITHVTAWTLWQRPRRVLVYVLTVELATALLTVGAARTWAISSSDLVRALVIWGCAAVYIEATRSIERVREGAHNAPYTDLNSMWTFSAALLVHPVLMAVIVSSNYLHRWLRVRRHVVHRQAFSASATVLAGYAAAAVLLAAGQYPAFDESHRDTGTYLMIAAAGITYLVVSTALVSGAIALSVPRASFAEVLAADTDTPVELAGMGLGVLVAWALTDWPIALTAVVGVPLALHGRVLVQQLRKAARTDPKTGLLNTQAWRDAARQQISTRPAAVLMIDLDHFKSVNDGHGHAAGDDVLVAVAATLSHEVRSSDVVGRFGGEEFVALLTDSTRHDALVVAERIRERVSETRVRTPADAVIQVTCSIGVAVHPRHGTSLDQLLQAADEALYAAKRSGRNQVRLASR